MGNPHRPLLIDVIRQNSTCPPRRRYGTAEACRIGLINEVVGEGKHVERAREVAEEIALNSGVSVKLSKEVLTAVPELELETAFEFTAEINARGRLNPECLEGIAAFLEKRKPDWRMEVERLLDDREDH